MFACLTRSRRRRRPTPDVAPPRGETSPSPAARRVARRGVVTRRASTPVDGAHALAGAIEVRS